MPELTDPYLHSLAARLDDEETIGILLLGSHARGEGGPFSDVDLRRYMRTETKGKASSYRFQDGWMVSVQSLTLEDEAEGLKKPARAIWTIPGLLQGRILLDKEGSLERLIASARQVNWNDLQPAADAYVSAELCGLAEEVFKLVDGLVKEKESKVIYATWGISEGLARVLLVQRGVLVPTENVFIDLAQSTAGRDSNWTKAFRSVLGMDAPVPGEVPYRAIGQAGLRLYRETVRLMGDLLQPEDELVINQTLDTVARAGY